MATYETDFSEYTDDVQPSDWTERWHTTVGTATVRAGTAVEHIMRFTQTSFSTSADHSYGISIRGSGDDTSETSYNCYVFESDELNIHKYVAGVSTTLLIIQLGLNYFVAGDYYWMRFRVNGTDLKGKIWRDETDEPSDWTAETTDSGIAGVGWVGTRTFDSTPDAKIDFFSVSTGGDTVPVPTDTSVVIRNTQQPVEVLLQSSAPTTRVTQVPVEVLLQSSAPTTRVTQVAVEVLMSVGGGGGGGGGGSAHLIIAT